METVYWLACVSAQDDQDATGRPQCPLWVVRINRRPSSLLVPERRGKLNAHSRSIIRSPPRQKTPRD